MKMIRNLILIVTCILSLVGCSEKEKACKELYYIYDFYNATDLVKPYALIVKEVVINDSTSKLYIVNHQRKDKKCGITYSREIYQKKNEEGIYFSEDSINYTLLYAFNGTKTSYVNFFRFWQNTDSIKVNRSINEKDTIDDYKEFLKFKENDNGTYPYSTTIFIKGITFPLLNIHTNNCMYYQLSAIIGNEDFQKYIEEAEKIKWDHSFLDIDITRDQSVTPCYIVILADIIDMKKRNVPMSEIIKVTGFSKDEIENVEEELRNLSGN